MSPLGCDLVGQFFRIFNEEGSDNRQGQVLGRPEPGHYLCQLFNWMGAPSCAKLARISEMLHWSFYPTEDELRDACGANINHSGALCDRGMDAPINDVFSRPLETER